MPPRVKAKDTSPRSKKATKRHASDPHEPEAWRPGPRLLPHRRQRFSGHDGASERAKDLPEGPSSLEDLYDWPNRVARALTADERNRIEMLLRRQICVYSDYSGYDTYREVLSVGLGAIAKAIDGERGVADPDSGIDMSTSLTFQRACDCAPLPQSVLKNISHVCDKGQSCVFNNLLDRLCPIAQVWIRNSAPGKGKSREEAADAMRAITEWMFDNRRWIFIDTSPCVMHGKSCPRHPALRPKETEMRRRVSSVGPAGPPRPRWRKGFGQEGSGPGSASASDGGGGASDVASSCNSIPVDIVVSYDERSNDSRPLYVHCSGMSCTGWSSAGNSLGFADPTEVANGAFVAERAHNAEQLLEDLFFGECTPNFPVAEKLEQKLSATHDLFWVITGPEAEGWPIKRTRMFCAGVNRASLAWVGDSDYRSEFRDRFCKSTQLTGDELFCAPDSDRMEYYEEMAGLQAGQRGRRRRAAIFDDDDRNRFDEEAAQDVKDRLHELVAPGFFQIYADHLECKPHRQSLGGIYIADLHQSPDVHTGTGPEVPTLLTHGIITSICGPCGGEHSKADHQVRIATGLEHLSMQGLHLFPATCTINPPSKLLPILANLAPDDQKFLAGNGIHAAVLNSWISFVLGNVVRKSASSGHRFSKHLSLEQIEDDVCNDDDGDDIE